VSTCGTITPSAPLSRQRVPSSSAPAQMRTDRRDAGRQRGDAELPCLVHRVRTVLHVDEQPVVIGGRGEHRGRLLRK